MKTKKIRGHRRRWEEIDHWIETNKNLDLDYLKEHQRHYAKIRVHPWSGIPVTNSQIPEPRGETKAKIINGLFEIYDSWKLELEKFTESCYLKIWLYEPRFSYSQVVCAIGECLDFYQNTFFKPNYSKELKIEKFGRLKSEVSKFSWEYRLDEDHFDIREQGSPEFYDTLEDYVEDKKRFEKMLKKPHRTTKFKMPKGEETEYYSFKKGDVWLGENKKRTTTRAM